MSVEQPNGEWLRKSKEIVKKLELEVDPTKVAAVMHPDEQVKKVGTSWPHWRRGNVVIDEHDRKLHTLESGGSDQMFVARLLKGILPVSDVVFQKQRLVAFIPIFRTKKFHSYEIPLDRVHSEASPSYTEGDQLSAYDFILASVFHDFDHPGNIAGHNSLANKDSVVLYDFDRIPMYFWFSISDAANRHPWRRSIGEIVQGMPVLGKRYARQLLSSLKERFEGPQGLEFLQAITNDMKSKGAGVPEIVATASSAEGEAKIAGFHRELVSRLDQALKILGSDPEA